VHSSTGMWHHIYTFVISDAVYRDLKYDCVVCQVLLSLFEKNCWVLVFTWIILFSQVWYVLHNYYCSGGYFNTCFETWLNYRCYFLLSHSDFH
jgi:hypothetical protein